MLDVAMTNCIQIRVDDVQELVVHDSSDEIYFVPPTGHVDVIYGSLDVIYIYRCWWLPEMWISVETSVFG